MKMRRILTFLLIAILFLNVDVKIFAKSGDYLVAPPTSALSVQDHFTVISGGSSYIDSAKQNVIVVTDNTANQRGGIWSNTKKDLTKPFQYDSYLYVGRSNAAQMGSYGAQIGGDGMTFTMHNDSRGLQATGGLGGGLGAYQRPGNSSETYISNAISIEVDPYVNDGAGDLDYGMTINGTNLNLSRHIAVVRPNDPLGQAKHNNLRSFSAMGFDVNNWYPFNISWEPNANGSGVLTYVINGNSMSYTIANYSTTFNGTSAYVGYTGATGGATALQAIAFTNIPGVSKVNFNLNGGTSAAIPEQFLLAGEYIVQPTAPTRANHTFQGWNTAQDGSGTNWNFSTMTVNGDDQPLYAQWRINSYQASFNVNGGSSAAPSPQTVNFGGLVTQPPTPTRTGYTFTNWNTSQNGSGTAWNFAVNTMPANAITLYAQWSLNSYQASFNVNGGNSVAPSPQSIAFGGLVSQPSAPTRVGHTFTNWNTNQDGTGTAWNFAVNTMPANPITLYAQWSVNSYEATFNVNGGGSATPNAQTVAFGGSLSQPATPTRTGYTFTNWNTSQDGSGTAWNFAVDTMPANAITLYAQWSVNSYEATFNVNGGSSVAPSPQSIAFGGLLSQPSAPTRTGYTFTNWNTSQDGTGTAWNFTVDTMPANAITLYAQWSVNSYEATFNVNGGNSVTPSPQNIDFGELLSEPIAPTREGYTFTNWNTSQDGTGTAWDFAVDTMPANAMTLYAQWSVNSYEATFNVNGGGSATPSAQTVAFGGLLSQPSTPTRTGYTFTNWNTSQDGTGTAWNFTVNTMPANAMTLYAQWSVNSYEVTFNVNGGNSVTPSPQNIDFGELLSEPIAPTREGYTFTNWNTSQDGTGTAWDFAVDTMPANAMTLYAQWSVNSYEATFNVNGGSSVAPSPQSINFGGLLSEPAAPTRTGYTFTNWNTSQDGTGTAWDFAVDTMPANAITLYAQWSVNSYEATFNVNGGGSATPSAQTVNFGGLLTEPSAPTRIGHTFTNWNTSQDGTGTAWDFAVDTMPANAITLYAQWSVNSYEATFNVNGGGSATPSAQTVAFGGLLSQPSTPTRTGYTFTNWNTSQDGTGTAWDFAVDTMPANAITLYAQWSINSYEATFNVNGGSSVAPSAQTVNYGGLLTEPSAPTRIGHTFTNWNTSQDGAGTAWDFAVDTMPANAITLYAQWSVNSYEATFNVNGGGSATPSAQTVAFGGLLSQPTTPTRTGYTFTNWNTSQDGTGTAWDFAVDTMPANAITLYAQWGVNSYEATFNVNGGSSVAPSPQSIDFGGLLSQPATPTRTGYTFTNWNTSQDGTGTAWNFAVDTMPANAITLYAQWSINSYEATFNVNGGGSATPSAQTVNFGGLLTEPSTPTRIGHTFTNWNTSQDGTGTAWDFAVDTMPANAITLYAQWSVNSYEATFNVNGGGSATPSAQTVNYGGLLSEPPAPTRIGHTFTNWNTSQDGTGTAWDFAVDTMPASAITLYAQWSINSYEATFSVNGGESTAPSAQTVNFGGLLSQPSTPTRTGHTFTNWNTSQDGSGTAWNFAVDTMPANAITLYAQWSVNSYEATFNVNGGGSATPSAQTVNFGGLLTEPSTPTRVGHTFTNWNTSQDGTGTAWDFAVDTMPASAITLYAQWSVNSYEATFNVNGGSSVAPSPQSIDFGGLLSEPSAPTRVGHTFTNWNTSQDGSGTTWDFAVDTMPANAITFYAQWSVNSYEATFNVNGGGSTTPSAQTVNFGGLLSEPSTPTRVGHTFTNWNTSQDGSGTAWNFAVDTMPASAITLYAQWSVNSYEATFNVNGGGSTTPSAQIVNFGGLLSQPATPTRTGYTFTNWNTSQDGTGTAWDFAVDTMPASAITLYAQWSVNSYEATFNVNGGGSAAPSTQTVNFGGLLSQPAVPTRVGHTFTNWNTSQDGSGTAWDFAVDTMPANAITLYAQWSVNSYVATFNVNGGNSVTPDPQNINFGGLLSQPVTPTRVGHTFTNWNTSQDGSGTAWNFAVDTMPANAITLYAQWSVNSYEATFNVNGGESATPSTQTVNFGGLLSEPATPTRVGYTFTNWNTSQDGSGTAWDFAVNTMPANAITLYAQWEVNKYEVTFDVNGGDSTPPGNQEISYGEFIVAPAAPTWIGHTFVGWNTSQDGSGKTWDFTTDRMPANNMTLYAQWNTNSYNLNFNVNGGAGVAPNSQSVMYGSTATAVVNPTRVGYTFSGWNTDKDGAGTAWNFVTSLMPANDVVLYAQWDLNSYELSFDVNGGESTPPTSQQVPYKDFAQSVATPTRTGYVFLGWNTLQDGSGTTWSFSSTPMPANDVTLYARWEEDIYNLYFNINGGEGLAPASQEVIYGTLVTPVTPPLRTGHTFSSWNTAEDGSGLTWDFSTTTMPADDTILYAQWDVNSYTASFDVNGGESLPPSSQQVVFNNTVTAIANPTRVGHTFIGWNTALDGSGITWNFSSTLMPANNLTLYAQWGINDYNLHFNVNGGDSITPEGQVIAFDALANVVTDPTRLGYVFTHWNTEQDGTGDVWDFAATRMPANGVTLYAQWQILSFDVTFDINGGETGTPSQQTVEYNALITEPSQPTKTGYTFVGWNTMQDGTGTAWNFLSTRMPASNLTLYAQWDVNTYVVSFNLNGGMGISPEDKFIDFGNVVLEPPAPTRVGHLFNGWNTQEDGAGITWDFSVNQMPANDITLYAQWEKSVMTLEIVPEVVVVELGASIDLLSGVNAIDTYDGQLIPTVSTTVDTSKVGVQIVTYTVTNSNGETLTGNRTYVIESEFYPAVVGEDYVIFASDFTKRVYQVDTNPAAIISAANAKAFNIRDASEAEIKIVDNGGYNPAVGAYTITYAVVEEESTEITRVATVIDNDASEIQVEFAELTYEAGTELTEEQLVQDAVIVLKNATDLKTDFYQVVDMNKVGVYEVTLTATVDFTSSASFKEQASETISSKITVHIVDNTETTKVQGDLKPTGENGLELIVLGFLIMVISTMIVFLLAIIRRRKSNEY